MPATVPSASRRGFLKFTGLAALAVSGSSVLVACGDDGAGDDSDSSTLKIAMIRPKTGDVASSFAPYFANAFLAQKAINADGGILGRQIEFKEYDDAASPAEEPAVARQIMQDGIKYVLGPVGSSQLLASLAVTGPSKILQAGYASADEVGDPAKYPLHYKFDYSASAQVAVRIGYLADTRGLTKIALLNEDTAAGASGRAAAKRELADRGLEALEDLVFEVGSTQIASLVSRLKASGAEAVDIWTANSTDALRIITALQELDWKPVVTGHVGLLFVRGGPDGNAPDGALYPEIFSCTYKALTYSDAEPITQEILDYGTLLKDSGTAEETLGTAATGPFYDYLFALKSAIESADSLDVAAVSKEMDNIKVEGLFGPFGFTPDDHTAYDQDVLSLAVVDSSADKMSNDWAGLFRRRAEGL